MDNLSFRETKLSRRGFLKGSAAVGAAAALYGCSSDSSDTFYGSATVTFTPEDQYLDKGRYYYGATGHNCGGRCLLKAHVVDGRVVRILADESTIAWDGSPTEPDSWNSSQVRACSKCRSYKGRLYLAGRLKFPLKQTKKRGDLSGFQRISWDQALREITDAHKAVYNEWGVEAIHSVNGCGHTASEFQSSSYGIFDGYSWDGMNRQYLGSSLPNQLGGFVPFVYDYSFHQYSYMGMWSATPSQTYTGYPNTFSEPPYADEIADVGKTIILWGANVLTTGNTFSLAWTKAIERMKMRDSEARVIFIGPEFVDTGVSVADEWIQIRPYTDAAVVLGMLYHMIDQTVKPDGTLRTTKDDGYTPHTDTLNLDYIDSCVYGFFDSPEYYLKLTPDEQPREFYPYTVNGIDFSSGTVKVNAVPPGQSLSAYVMGDDDRLTKLAYGADNYMANEFTANDPAITRNMDTCSYSVKAPEDTKYLYKKDMKVPKTPKWASEISGVPEAKIKELAEIFLDESRRPIWNDFSGAQQKQGDGVVNIFIMQALMLVTKTWGRSAEGWGLRGLRRNMVNHPHDIAPVNVRPDTWAQNNIPRDVQTPVISCTAWHNAIKYGFGNELKANGYVPNIPDFPGDVVTGKVYHNDGGVKSLIRWERDTTATGFDYSGKPLNTRIKVDNDGYFVPMKVGGEVVRTGVRFMINTGGNIPMNQHMNTIDTMMMFEALPSAYDGVTAAKDAFYLVCFDNFMSSTARWSDYVLPAKTSFEQDDFRTLFYDNSVYCEGVSEGPGESKSTWEFGRDWLKYELGEEAARTFTGLEADSTFRDVFIHHYNTEEKTNPESPFYQMEWEDYLKKPYISPKPVHKRYLRPENTELRQAVEDYLASPDLKTKPFSRYLGTCDENTAYGSLINGNNYVTEPGNPCPKPSGRFQVYSGALVWRYENQYNKYHSYLPLEERGQKHPDEEGDKIVYPIPMYFHYKDFFVQAYGLSGPEQLDGRLSLTTTHDRYRAHSSHNENPFMRELNHRVPGGKLHSGVPDNYALIGDAGAQGVANGTTVTMPYLQDPNGNKIAYHEIWVNESDAADNDIGDGDLVEVYNEIGAVRCVARVTGRCTRGYLALHEGAWFNPVRDESGAYIRSPFNGKVVDFGGCANTLMSSKPSRIDHGNSQQAALVSIKPIR